VWKKEINAFGRPASICGQAVALMLWLNSSIRGRGGGLGRGPTSGDSRRIRKTNQIFRWVASAARGEKEIHTEFFWKNAEARVRLEEPNLKKE